MNPADESLHRVREMLIHFPGDSPENGRARLGEIAVRKGFLTPAQLDECRLGLEVLRAAGQAVDFEEVLARQKYLTADQFLEVVEALQKEGPAAEAPAEPAPPSPRVGKYRLIREIGRGGMGIVYEAEDADLERRVALKIVREQPGTSALVRRLHREATIVAKLRHPNIVSVHDVGTVADALGERIHYIAMDLVDGRTLADLLKERRTIRGDLLRMVEEIARAAEFAHANHVIHRDLKPSNVLVDAAGRVYLTDFGLARAEFFPTAMTRSSELLGTPQYMAPEQVRGKMKLVDERTDVYALGVMLYEILVGHPPYRGANASEVLAKITESEAVAPRKVSSSVAADLEVICLKAIEKNPAHRYASARAFADDLKRFRSGEPIEARPVSSLRRWARKAVRSRWVRAVAGALVVGIVGGAVFLGQRWKQERSLVKEHEARQRWDAARKRLAAIYQRIADDKVAVRRGLMRPDKARAKLEESVAQVDGFIAEWPDRPQGYFVRARGRMYLGDFEGAEKDLREALRLHPAFRPAWSALAIAKAQQASEWLYEGDNPAVRFEDMHRDLEEMLARGPVDGQEQAEFERWDLPWSRDEEVLMEVARFRKHRKGECAQALRFLEQKRRECDAEEFAFELARDLADGPEKSSLLDEAVAMAPGFAQAYLERGLARARSKDFSRAVSDYLRAGELEPRNVRVLWNVALARAEMGEGSQALRDCERALSLCPGDPRGYLTRAEVKWKVGDVEGALEDCTQVIRQRPDQGLGYCKRGTYRYLTGRFEAAREDFDQALRIAPQNVNALLGRAASKRSLGDLRGALGDYDSALELRPDHAEAYFDRAGVHGELANSQNALADYTRAIERRTDYRDAFFNRGVEKSRMADHPGAAADFTRAIELGENSACVYRNRGMAKQGMRDWEGATADFGRAVKLQPDVGWNYYLRASASSDRTAAMSDLDRAIELHPYFVEALDLRAQIREAAGDPGGARQDRERAEVLRADPAVAMYCRAAVCEANGVLDDALREISRAIERKSDWPEAFLYRGRLRRQKGDHVAAAKDFDRALELKPDSAAALLERGNQRFDEKDYRRARIDYDAYLALKPDDVSVLVDRSTARHNLGDLDGALQDAELAIALAPTKATAYRRRGRVKKAMKDLPGAMADFDQALKLTSHFSDAYMDRADLKADLGDHAGAIPDYDRAIQFNPDSMESYFNRAISRKAVGDDAGALKDYDRVLQLRPDHARGYYNRGCLLCKMGDLKGALADVDKAIRLQNDYAEAYQERAELRHRLGDGEGAIADAREAVRLLPADSPARELAQRALDLYLQYDSLRK